MNNVWKGLVVGAVTGAAIGLSIDLLRRAGDGVASLAELAREHGPDAAAAVSAAVGASAERLREADLPGKLRDADLPGKLRDADLPGKLREADLPGKLREAVHSAADSDAAQTIRQAAKATTDRIADSTS